MKRTAGLLALVALLANIGCGTVVESAALSGGGGDATIAAGGSGGSAGTGGEGAGPSGLPAGIHAFDGPEESLPTGDLAPFAAMIDGAALVGLGESIHTSGGYLQLKARLIEYLVTEHGFRVLAMETPHTAAESVGTYVATCQGNAVESLQGIFGVFASQDTADLVDWLCQYNMSHGDDPVRFVGFDAQQPWDDQPALQTFLASAAPNDASALLGSLSPCDAYGVASQQDYYGQGGFDVVYAADAYAACLSAIDALDGYLDANAAALAAATSARDLEWARIASLAFRSWQGEKFYYKSDLGKSYEARDVAMAAILERQRALDFPDQKVIVWAHNYHLTERHVEVADEPDIGPVLTTGTVLKQHLGDAYRAFALIGYDVEINWPGVGVGSTDLPSPGALEDQLHGLGQPSLIVDLHAPGIGGFIAPGMVYDFGTPEPAKLVPADQFRGAFYLDHSPLMEALFW